MAAMFCKRSLSTSGVNMFSDTLKLHRNAHAVRGRPTLKDVERFRIGSIRELYERSIYERTLLSEPSIENYRETLSTELSNVNLKPIHDHRRLSRRDREPSRIPIRTMERLKNKSRKVKEFVYERIRSTIPKSSKLYCYLKARKQENKAKFLLKCSVRLNDRIVKLKRRASQYLSCFSCNKLISLYKTQTHVTNYCEFKLSRDIEKNPGPTDPRYIDSSKTIAAPYSQGYELVFGQNAGQQCVAMSLCSLIYYNKQGINSANDLVSIMSIGNQLYSSLSQLAGQSYLMQTELPTMLNVFETDYELQYSESYTGTIHQDPTIEGYQYCSSLQRAFESLMAENYTNFVLTVGCTAVAVYSNSNVGFKIFDSHARDLYGRGHPQGTCVLLEVSSLNSLVHYFKSIHNNDMFEVKGVKINEVQNSIIGQNTMCEITEFNQSCAVAIYSICYSIIKSSSYWNSNTLSSIVNYGKRLCDRLSLKDNFSTDDLPKTIDVCGTEVSLHVLTESRQVLSDSLQSKSMLEDAIQNNECTGFLMWFESYCISCIFKPTTRSKYVYSLLVYNESHIPPIQFTKCINGIQSLVDVISKIQSEHRTSGHYTIQFVSCSCKNVDVNDRKNLMKRQREIQNYETMEPSKKKMLLDKKQTRNTANKHELKRKRIQKYKTMDTAKKQDLLNKQTEKYITMDTAKKQVLLERCKQKYCNNKNTNVDSCIEKFKKKIREGPYYICSVCNRILYRKSVKTK